MQEIRGDSTPPTGRIGKCAQDGILHDCLEGDKLHWAPERPLPAERRGLREGDSVLVHCAHTRRAKCPDPSRRSSSALQLMSLCLRNEVEPATDGALCLTIPNQNQASDNRQDEQCQRWTTTTSAVWPSRLPATARPREPQEDGGRMLPVEALSIARAPDTSEA